MMNRRESTSTGVNVCCMIDRQMTKKVLKERWRDTALEMDRQS